MKIKCKIKRTKTIKNNGIKKSILSETILHKLFYKKIYKDLKWKKKLLDSCYPDLVAKNLNSIKRIQILFLIKNIIRKTKNKKLIISLFLFLFKIGLISSISNFFKYNINYKKFKEFIFIFFASLELEYYNSFRNSIVSINNGFSLKKSTKYIPKEYLRLLILFLKKINNYMNIYRSKKRYLNKLKNIKKILNVILYVVSSIEIWFQHENYLLYFFHIIVKEIWIFSDIFFLAKFFIKTAKLEYFKKEKIYCDLLQYIISQLFIENITILQFLNQINSILKCLKPKPNDLDKSNKKIIDNLKQKKNQANFNLFFYTKNRNEFVFLKKYFLFKNIKNF
jgi:hypothetical protein